MSRADQRRARQRPKGRVFFAILGVLCLVYGVVLTVNNRTYAALPEEGPSSAVTAAPRPNLLNVPSATPTPTSTPSPAPTAESKPWAFEGATLTISKLGIDHSAVTEYTKADLKTEWVYSEELGQLVEVPDSIVPDGPETIAWYSSIDAGGSILSSQATNTVYLFCHKYGWDWAICNELATLQPGDVIIIETPTERLTYTMDRPSIVIDKIDLKNQRAYTDGVAGRVVMVTCHPEGSVDVNGHAVQNTLATFQLTAVESLVPQPTTINPEVASRLE